MDKTFKFWWMCVKRAARGNAAFANDWQWLVGYPATAISLWILGYFYAELSGRIEVTLATGALGALAAAFVAYIITWSVSFIARLLNAPTILFFEQKDRADKLEEELRRCSPLRVIFDVSNPHNRFWERTSPRDESGKKLPGLVWEYRVKIQNTSSKTVRNVRISRESSGLIPEMPSDLVFQKNGKQNRDLQPLCDELVAVFWKFPPQEGDAWGGTATAFHGPIKVIASGDDVSPAECEFDYYPDQIPVIVQRDSS